MTYKNGLRWERKRDHFWSSDDIANGRLRGITEDEETKVKEIIGQLEKEQKLLGLSISINTGCNGRGSFIQFNCGYNWYGKKIFLTAGRGLGMCHTPKYTVITKARKIFTEEKEKQESQKQSELDLAKRLKELKESRKRNTEKFHLDLGPALGSLYFNIKYAKRNDYSTEDGYSRFKLNLENGITVSCNINDDYSTQTITGIEGVDTTKLIKLLNEIKSEEMK